MVSENIKKVLLVTLAVSLIALLIIGNNVNTAPKRSFQDTRALMGTDITIQVYGSNQEETMDAIEEAYSEIKRIENIANRYDKSSELYKLNDQKTLENPSEDLKKLILTSKHYYNVTDGAFDITIVPLLNLWSKDQTLFNKSTDLTKELNEKKLPETLYNDLKNYEPSLGNLSKNPEIIKSESILDREVKGWEIKFDNQLFYITEGKNELKVFTKMWLLPNETQERLINQTMPVIGSNKIKITNDTISLKEGMKISLDGIAKGYAVDSAMETLKKQNVQSALINAGGDIRTLGTKPTGDPWIIGLRNPENKNESITELKLKNKSIATSGNYERYFNQNASIGHIINPKTGRSTIKLSSASIISDNCTESDVLATASFILGSNKSKTLIESRKNVEGILLDYENPKNITKTSGIEEFQIN